MASRWTAILIVVCVSWSSGEFLLGGLGSEVKPSDDDRLLKIIPTVSGEIRSQVAAKMASGDSGILNSFKDAPITVLSYRTQVVSGVNYFVKAKIGKTVFLLRIYEPLPSQGKPSLDGVKGPIKESDPIEYFSAHE